MSAPRLTKVYKAATEALADKRQVRVICSTEEVDRAGEIVVQTGIDFSHYMASGAGTVLWNHDTDKPIAKCVDIVVRNGRIEALVQFPPEGEDEEADRYYAKIKFGSVSGISIGFAPIEMEPLDRSNPKKGPQKYLKAELLEFSFTPVQANRGSLVIERGAGAVWKVGASLNLSASDEAGWDEGQASESIFDKAGFGSDTPDPTFARKGFLLYDASRPADRKSYQLPFAKMVDGRLVADAEGLKAAGEFLQQSSIPEDVAEKARAVINHYEGKMAKTDKPVAKTAPAIKVKGLYDIGRLASLLSELGWVHDCSVWEAQMEEDGSAVPKMLADAMQAVAAALLAMTAEEVAELLAQITPEGEIAVKAGIVPATASPIKKAFAAARVKAGRKFSASTRSSMRSACKSIMDGHDALVALIGVEEEDDDEGEEPEDVEKNAKPDMGAAVLLNQRQRRLEVMRRQAA